MLLIRRLFLVIAAVGVLALLAGLLMQKPQLWGPGAAGLVLGLAIGIAAFPALKTYQFTLWIIAVVTIAMIYTPAFIAWDKAHYGGQLFTSIRDKRLILIIIQLVMFGMGTQMSLHDFVEVAKSPRGVFVGIVCHFSVMPLVGFALTKMFIFPADTPEQSKEIAAGIILIGSCSSGLASNVMAFIARANLGLSVAVTAVTTMIAPIMTPFLFKTLAEGSVKGQSFFDMMMEIVKITIVPIAAALIHDYLKTAPITARRTIHLLAAIGVAWIAIVMMHPAWIAQPVAATAATAPAPAINILAAILEVLSYCFGAIVVGLIYHQLVQALPIIIKWMPVFSMAGIVYFTTVTTAAGQQNLLKVGWLLFFASVIHNAAGYCFGYWLSRAAGLDKNSARSVAFEVGLQNGGMASGLAASLNKIGTVGLAPAIFSPWMNVSGSLLANYWRRKPVGSLPPDEPPAEMQAVHPLPATAPEIPAPAERTPSI